MIQVRRLLVLELVRFQSSIDQDRRVELGLSVWLSDVKLQCFR